MATPITASVLQQERTTLSYAKSPCNYLAVVRAFEKSRASRTTVARRVGIMPSVLIEARKSGEYPQGKNAFGDIDLGLSLELKIAKSQHLSSWRDCLESYRINHVITA